MYKHFDESKSISWSESVWKDWINNKLEDRKAGYLSNPKDRIAAYIRERDYKEDYQGRELLELIQNADDAGVDYKLNQGANKLLIKVTENALFVANTGISFSAEGVESLMISNLSPKRFAASYIGSKGLGFRSILGWSKTVIIKSGNLSVAFSGKYSKDWLKTVRKTSPGVDRGIKESEKNAIATLSTPVWLDESIIEDEVMAKVNRAAADLIKKSYDTVICLVFKKDKFVKKQIQKELKVVNTELLLFLQHIEELQIVNDKGHKSWTVERSAKHVVTCDEKNRKNKWNIEKDEGKIPPRLLKDKKTSGCRYEIKIAIPERPVQCSKLSVYFPTKHDFPFPFYAHATFDLHQNRQHVNANEVNKYIARKLAKLMVRSAVKLRSKKDPWEALDLVSPREKDCLEEVGFLDALHDQIRKNRLIPVRNADFMCPKDVLKIEHDFDQTLKGIVFSDLALHVDNEQVERLLRKLQIKDIKDEDLCKRINRISTKLTLEEKTDLIVQLMYMKGHGDFYSEVKPQLLIDDKGGVIRSNNILYPDEKGEIEIPDWVPQKIINKEQVHLLKEKQDRYSEEDLISVLDKFNVKAINKESLVGVILETAQKKIRRTASKKEEITKQMVGAIWHIYNKDEEEWDFPEEGEIYLPTRTGEYSDVNDLYMGSEYEKGSIAEYLFRDIDKGLFVAGPEVLGLDDGGKEICEFLEWIGISCYPRPLLVELNDEEKKASPEYVNEVVSNLEYPVTCGKLYKFTKREELGNYFAKEITIYKSFHLMEEILEKADQHAVLAWVHRDPNVVELIDDWDDEGKMLIRKYPARNYHRVDNQNIYPYPLWLLKSTSWIISQDMKKNSPDHCLIRKDDYLFPRIGVPLIDEKHNLFKKTKMEKRDIGRVLSKVGVASDIGELSWDAFYSVLYELPKSDKNGKTARSIYRKFIEQVDDAKYPKGEMYDKYIEKGKMYGKMGEKYGYFPVADLYYSDSLTKSEIFSHFHPMLDLEAKKGAAKVKKIFRVKKITEKQHKIQILNYEEVECSQSIQLKLNNLKPYIYALFIDSDKKKKYFNIIHSLEIKICTDVDIALTIEKDTKNVKLTRDHIWDNKQTNIVYILIDNIESIEFHHNSVLCIELGEIFSELINIDKSKDIAPILMSRSHDRMEVIDKLSGGCGEEKIRQSKRLFGVVQDSEDLFLEAPTWVNFDDEEDRDLKNLEQEDLSQSLDGKDENHEKKEEKVDISELDSFVATPKTTIISTPRKDTAAIVRKTVDKDTPLINKKRDGDVSEKIVMSFEKKQGRYPLDVAKYRGSLSYGCDIISFDSLPERESFLANPKVDDISRFIEVKGKADKTEGIILAGNQLLCAEQFRARFYLYRVHKSGDMFEITTLNNPLDSAEENVLVTQYEVNLRYSKRSQEWDFFKDK